MRTALQDASLRGNGRIPQSAFQVEILPPPVGGWNKRDALPLMDDKDAIRLDNWIPDTNSVHLRGGFATHAIIEATATAIESLIQYVPPNTTNAKMFAAIPTAIYDVTAAATASATAAVVTGLTNGRWQHSQMTNTAGSFLVICNGADAPRTYNGTTWATCSVTTTGLSISNLIGVHNHMNRLWFIEENQNYVWYLGTSAIAGAMTQFLLPFRKGGKLMAMGTWSRDGGAGPDDFAVFVSNRGEICVYSGTDPSAATTWALLGYYNIPEVIGRRCIHHAGADLGVLTSQGLVSLARILSLPEGAAGRASFTDKISGQFREQYRSTGTLFGWESIEYPKKNLLIVNVPIAERTTQHQYVMNINTGAWCRFTGINGGCWSLLGDNIYFGGNDAVVRKFDSTTMDGTSNITAVLQSAYSTFRTAVTKHFTMARPIFLAPTQYVPPVTIQTNYDTSEPSISTVVASTSGTQWDAAQWDSFQWAGGDIPTLNWQTIAGEGRAGSIAFGVSSSETLTYNGCDVGFERGGYL
jgi:hypothetical protein